MMRIGEVARQAGVSVDTVRYYERLGLVSASRRTSGGFREFDDETVPRIMDVRALQGCGVTLEEAAALLVGGSYNCDEADNALARVVSRLNESISALETVRDRAAATRARCTASSCEHGEASAISCC